MLTSCIISSASEQHPTILRLVLYSLPDMVSYTFSMSIVSFIKFHFTYMTNGDHFCCRMNKIFQISLMLTMPESTA